MTSPHIEWLHRVTQGDSNRAIAHRSGISDATLSRQIRAGELTPENLIKIAESYNESPVYALVDLGFISARWVNEPGVITALSRASDEQLTDELLRRLKLIEDIPVDQLAEQRADMPLRAVADSSPDEDALREEKEGGDWTDPDNIP